MQRHLSKLLAKVKELWKRGAFYVIGGSFLSKLAAFLGSIVVVRILTKSDYGALTSLENIYAYAYVFVGYGLNNALIRYMVIEDEDSGKKGILFHVLKNGTIFNLVLVLFVVFLVACFLAEDLHTPIRLLIVLLCALPFQFVFDAACNTLRALFQNKQYALFSFLSVATIWLAKVIFSLCFGLSGAVSSWPVAYLLLSGGAISFVLRRYFVGVDCTKAVAGKKKEMRSYSIQYMITNGLWSLFLQNDLLLIGIITGSSLSVATYKIAYAIPAALSLFSASIGVFVLPYFVKHENERGWIWRNYKSVLLCSSIIIGLCSGVIFIFADPIVCGLYGANYADAVDVMRLLLLSAFVNNAIRYTAANIIASIGRIKINLVVSAAGMALQIVLNLMLIPCMGVYGAALTSIIVYCAMAIAVTIYFVREFRAIVGK